MDRPEDGRMRAMMDATMALLPADRAATALLFDLDSEFPDTMPETKRNARLKVDEARAKDRAKNGKVLAEYVEENWRPKTNVDLASAAECSPGTITSLFRDGFDMRNKSASRICKVLGVDFKTLCLKHVAQSVGFQLKGAPKAKLLEAAEKLIGTDQEQLALDYLQFALSKAKR